MEPTYRYCTKVEVALLHEWADALALAASEVLDALCNSDKDLIVDVAGLKGAARAANLEAVHLGALASLIERQGHDPYPPRLSGRATDRPKRPTADGRPQA